MTNSKKRIPEMKVPPRVVMIKMETLKTLSPKNVIKSPRTEKTTIKMTLFSSKKVKN